MLLYLKGSLNPPTGAVGPFGLPRKSSGAVANQGSRIAGLAEISGLCPYGKNVTSLLFLSTFADLCPVFSGKARLLDFRSFVSSSPCAKRCLQSRCACTALLAPRTAVKPSVWADFSTTVADGRYVCSNGRLWCKKGSYWKTLRLTFWFVLLDASLNISWDEARFGSRLTVAFHHRWPISFASEYTCFWDSTTNLAVVWHHRIWSAEMPAWICTTFGGSWWMRPIAFWHRS